jgi:hypothetical protein
MERTYDMLLNPPIVFLRGYPQSSY